MSSPVISRIEAQGVHQQFDFSLNLNPGLNIIYGKNGLGKTTLLHIVANILELDFERFRHLHFRRIRVETQVGDFLELIAEDLPERRIRISFNGNDAGSHDLSGAGIASLSPIEQGAIRAAFGGRSIYLPAFRAVLERVRSDYMSESQRTGEYERIRNEELTAISEAGRKATLHRYSRGDTAAQIARKTIQCRDWFGKFVPVIRYPSIVEVIDSLTEEFRNAQIESGASERRMLSQTFIDVFKAMLSKDQAPNDTEIESLIARVEQSIKQEDLDDTESRAYTENIGQKLGHVLAQVKGLGGANEGAAERRVIKLYADLLERRNQERKAAFAKVKQFENAVNKFLDGKTLHVKEDFRSVGSRPTPARSIYIETSSGRSYGLTALSSGERQVLTMLFSATRMTSLATGVFLIDEPELSLHVDWQRMIIGELMAQAPERQIIACTHSPEVGADHFPSVQLFDPTSFDQIDPGVSSAGESLLEESL